MRQLPEWVKAYFLEVNRAMELDFLNNPQLVAKLSTLDLSPREMRNKLFFAFNSVHERACLDAAASRVQRLACVRCYDCDGLVLSLLNGRHPTEAWQQVVLGLHG